MADTFPGGNIGSVVEVEPLAVTIGNPALQIPTVEKEPLPRVNPIVFRNYNPATFIQEDGLSPATYDKSPYSFSSGVGQFFVLKRAEEDSDGVVESEGKPSLSSPLKEGSQGREVKIIQSRLQQLGFDVGGLDGIFGAKTAQAVKDFQKSQGITVDGIVGQQTLGKLFTSPQNKEPETVDSLPQGTVLTPEEIYAELESLGVRVEEEYLKGVVTRDGSLVVYSPDGQLLRYLLPPSTGGLPDTTPSELTQTAVASEQKAAGFSTNSTPNTYPSPIIDEIPKEWKFVVAPGSISWSKRGNVNRDNPYATNKQLVYYSGTSMRTLSLGECLLEGFSIGKSVEAKIKALEKCMEVDRQPQGFMAPYVWELFGIGKSYGFYLISNVSVQEVLRDDRGNATRAIVSLELTEVPEYQVYNGRDLTRPDDLVTPNFCINGGGGDSPSASGTPASSGVPAESEAQLRNQGFKGSLQPIKDFESFSPTPYPDAGGLSIGYGTKDSYLDSQGNTVQVTSGSRITEAEAQAALARTFSKKFLPCLTQIPHWNEMTPNQQSALASFSWNLGACFYQNNSGAFATINKALSSKDNWDQVPSALALYDKSEGKRLEGLTQRRKREGELWRQ